MGQRRPYDVSILRLTCVDISWCVTCCLWLLQRVVAPERDQLYLGSSHHAADAARRWIHSRRDILERQGAHSLGIASVLFADRLVLLGYQAEYSDATDVLERGVQ